MEEELLGILAREVLVKDSRDFISWSGDSKGMFSVKSAYGLLANHDSAPSNVVFCLLWKTKVVPKVLTTAWRILLDRISTYQNLGARGIVVNSPLCVFCNLYVESTQHLFLDCTFAYCVWMLCYRWIGIVGTQNKDICNHFLNFHLTNMSEKQNQV